MATAGDERVASLGLILWARAVIALGFSAAIFRGWLRFIALEGMGDGAWAALIERLAEGLPEWLATATNATGVRAIRCRGATSTIFSCTGGRGSGPTPAKANATPRRQSLTRHTRT